MRTIKQLHLEKTGKLSDKWESYLSYYDDLFLCLCDAPITLLEIGIQNGGSLDTWAKFFPNAQAIVGCDIDEKCNSLVYDDPKIHVVVGDANSEAANTKIRKISSEFDIIIDDGSHISSDILNSFLIYFPLVRPGGIYVVEDAHTLYDNSFGGGILNEFSALTFFKKLVDMVSYQFWARELTPSTLLFTYFEGHSIPPFISEGWIDSIEFRNSIITIKKAKQPGHEKLGKRIITGTELTVKDEAWLKMVKG
ncbi:Methyltransferase domain-containing protein [Polynucleobacter meluiroseus]|uniref:Methyltransferase domain-containing protein n=1 Tax=Polynucleobacter meluiroseus TaxID=1938814 RepID=A0A240E0G1_9BURK|nr:class I SAM-dependent methyltransferase [Polynucleobacter meluiroseus]SNX28928.1 Methyltransferase domain-containing protein [Polynucleobacter meluiroseus]